MTHEFDGQQYKAASAHQKEWGMKLIQELCISGSEHILDLGCGDGALTSRLAMLTPHGSVIGIDASHGMIDAARSHHAANLSFQIGDINNLNFENEFDIVFSNAALHWIKNHRTLLGNVLRALKKGGILKCNFAGDGNCANFMSSVKEAINHPTYTYYFADYEWPWYMPPIEEYKQLVQSIPFTENRIWEENADHYFPDQEILIRWIDQPSLVPFMKQIPDEHKENFRRFVIDRMIRKTHQTDGRFFERFRRINVTARK